MPIKLKASKRAVSKSKVVNLTAVRNNAFELAASSLELWYPDNANTNAFCAAIRSLKQLPKFSGGTCSGGET